MTDSAFRTRLAAGQVLVLDGATGTELQRRGVDTALPLWSARALIEAPAVLRAIHAAYVAAGADIITTNTFRTHRRTLTRAGIGARARELTALAVQIAREAAQADRTVFVAGSMSPLEDCYAPHRVPPNADLQVEHAEMAQQLAEAGCDVLLVETMNTIREAVIAAQCATATGLPVCVSFVVGPGGRPPDQIDPIGQDEPLTLLSSESLAEAVAALRLIDPAVIMINCVPLAFCDRALAELRALCSGSIGLYANVGHADDAVGWTLTDDVQPAAYAQHARRWCDQGAIIVGGCCGTTPEYITALSDMVRKT
jgi:S-methylmethionine-dependent homocysteine/selenocysteine methylase